MCHRQGYKVQYLGPWAINWKNKDILLSQTLKVEEKKGSLVFLFVAWEPRYRHFIFWNLGSKVCDIVKLQKCQYLGSWALNWKNMDALLSQTLKVEEKKVPLVFFYLWPRSRDMAILSFVISKEYTKYNQLVIILLCEMSRNLF